MHHAYHCMINVLPFFELSCSDRQFRKNNLPLSWIHFFSNVQLCSKATHTKDSRKVRSSNVLRTLCITEKVIIAPFSLSCHYCTWSQKTASLLPDVFPPFQTAGRRDLFSVLHPKDTRLDFRVTFNQKSVKIGNIQQRMNIGLLACKKV